MPGQSSQRLIEIVAEASQKPPAEREAYVRAALPDGSEQAEALSLLMALGRAGAFLDRPTLDAKIGESAGATLGEGPGSMIGRYKLLELIGEGGFGAVFKAEQREPVFRMVAVKIIKLGMDTRQVVARFEAERQALAMMDYPNIAKVLDGGSTETGRPYFVMELVRGDPITRYCDANNLSTAQRLELFTQVCHAVQHAHQKGIIHRDLKPSNVLVTVSDGRPLPKVIDFGIAKATSARLTEKTLFTEHRALIGTPEYMSPEQADAGSADIDTRSDIYSLGVLLYELLTSVTPFDGAQLRSAAWGELQRIIREVEPPKPSTRLSTMKDALPGVAAHRQALPARLSGQVRGDLDWIVMKCLEKERSRRYDTAAGLALDVQRHLAGEPVVAAPPSAVYRVRKFVRRNRGPVVAGVVVFASLVAGLGVALWQKQVASHERDAQKKAAAEATAARLDADQRRKETEQVSEFQSSQLKGIKPALLGQRLHDDLLAEAKTGMDRAKLSASDVSARQVQFESLLADVNLTNVALKALDENIFDRAITAAHEQFKDQPLVSAKLLETIADTMIHLGLLAPADAPQAEVVAIRRKELGNDHVDTMAAINNMGYLFHLRGKYEEAEKWFREAEGLRRRVLGPDHRHTLTSLNNVGSSLLARGQLKESEPFLREALDRRRVALGSDDPDTLQSLNNVAGLMWQLGRLPEAETMDREALEQTRKARGEDHPDTLESISNLGVVLQAEGKLAEAEPLYLEALEKRRRILGDDNTETLDSINNVAFLYSKEKKPELAEPLYKEVIERSRRVRGADHPSTLGNIVNYAGLLRDQGRLADAEPLYREALAGYEHRFGHEYWLVGHTRTGLGRVLTALARYTEAESELLEGERVLGAAQGSSPARHAQAVKLLVALYEAWDKAEPGKGYDAKAAVWAGKLDPATPVTK